MNRVFRIALAALLCLLPPGLSKIVATEVGNDNPTGVTGEYNGSITTAGSYDPYTGNAKRFIDDLVVTGSVGAYPLKWTRALNSRGVSGPFGDGGGWKHSYQWGLNIQPDPNHCVDPPPPAATVSYPDGRTMTFRHENQPPRYEDDSGGEPGDRLVQIETSTNYDLMLKDGGRVEFRTVYGRPHFPKYIVDPYGQKTTLDYIDNGIHAPTLVKITEPAGRYLKITYKTFPEAPPSYPALEVIDYVEAWDGVQENHPTETVHYDYEDVRVWNGTYVTVRFFNLIHARYDDETQGVYQYLPPALVHPGDTRTLGAGHVEICNDVRFEGAMSKIEYEYVPASTLVASGQIRAEKNATTHQPISNVNYPLATPASFTRTETRADNAKRVFTYYDHSPELKSYTDFFYPGQPFNTTSITFPTGAPADHEYRAVTDARGHRTKVEKEMKIGAVMAVIHHNDSKIQYHYTDANNPNYADYKIDENIKYTYYDRYSNTDLSNPNRVWQVRYPDGGLEQFTYNNLGQILTHLLTSNGTETFTYDRGLKTSYMPPWTVSDPQQHKTFYFYYGGPSGPGEAPDAPVRADLMDRLRRVIDPRGNSTWYEYNPRGQVTRVTYDDGAFTENSYNPDGTLQWSKDELGHKTDFFYDDYKRLTKVKNALGKETLNSYEPWNGYGPYSHTTSSIYLTTLPSLKKIKRDYDSNFRLLEITEGWSTADAAKTTSTYDEVGNLKTVKDPKGQISGLVTTYAYDNRDRRESVTDPLDHMTEWLYDDAGNMKRETRADTKFRTWDEYDAMNRIKHTTGFLGAPDTTSYNYDPAGNRTEVIDANQRHYQTTYDQLNRRSSASYPIDATGLSRSEAWRYDVGGNVLWYKNPAFQYKHFEYDLRNRQRRSYWNGLDTDATSDWSIGQETATTLDTAGRVTEIKTNNGETLLAYGYDDANHKIWEDQTLAGWPTRRVETNPDDDGNRGTLSVAGVPGGYSFTYEYTPRQRLWHINRGGSPYFEYSYDLNGNLKKRQHMSQGQGQNSTTFAYDDVNRVTLCDQKRDDQSYFARSNYNDYDLVNNLKSISREEDGNKGELFLYDHANQLSSVSYKADVTPHAPGGGGDPGEREHVEKDEERETLAALEADPDREPLAFLVVEPDAASGPRTITYNNDAINRMSMTDGPTVTNYAPNHLNQYTTAGRGALTYDTKFDLSGYDGWVYGYDAEKRLISANSTGGNSAQFVYDGVGRCVKRTIDGVTTVFTYDGWKPVAEWKWTNGASALVAWNLYGPGADEILVRYQVSPAGYLYYHLDANGNVQFLLSEALMGLEKYTYDVFGKPTIRGWNGSEGDVRPISSYGNRFLFTGREYLYTLGLYDYRHRIYNPELGRFMQTDPLGQQVEGTKLSAEQAALYTETAPETFSSSELNLYRYCHGNPLNKTDPNGTVDRSYTPGTSDYADQLVWEPTYNPKGIFTIAGHGDETGILRQGSNVPISTIMADMAKDGYKPGTPVLLVVCESGKGPNPFAGKLATALADKYGVKTSVHAPTTEFGVFKKGEKPVVMPERNRDFKTRREYDRSRPGKLLEFTVEPKRKGNQ